MHTYARALVENILTVTYPNVLKRYSERKEEIATFLHDRKLGDKVQSATEFYKPELYAHMVMEDSVCRKYERFLSTVQRAINALEPDQKKIISCIVEFDSPDDAADILQLSKRSFYREKQRTLDALAQHMLGDIYLGGIAT
jgi:DNA-directed RNA polymerase specialized sigma24 family protein